MSLIADALRTAQRERERHQDGSQPHHMVAEGFFAVNRRRRHRQRRRLMIAAAAVATLSLGGLAFGMLQPSDSGLVDTAGVPAAELPLEPRPVAMAAGQPEDADADATPPTAVAEPRAAADTYETGTEATAALATAPQATAPPAAPPPSPAASPGAPTEPPGTGAPARDEAAADRAVPDGRAAGGSGVQLRVGAGLSGDFTELFAAALAAQQRGDASRARELYEQLVLARPQWAQAHSNLGATYRSLGDHVRAEASFRRALALDPEFAAAWSNLGMLLHATGRDGEAMAALQHALKLEPYVPGTRVNLATVMHASGLLHEAHALLQDAVSAAPLMPEAHYAMARVLEELGRPSDAARHYDLFLVHADSRFPQLEGRVREHLAALRRGSP